MFKLVDRWVWDFWSVEHDGLHHLFYLQAPRSLGDPELRHHAASVGHAVSPDWRDWTVLPDAVAPGPPGSWDDLATWTGSTVEHGGRWHLLYTGVSREEGGLVQRIGAAVSGDLIHFEKHPANPLIESDPRWYEQAGRGLWQHRSWRDPWVYWDPDEAAYVALITARTPSAPPDGAGVIARARSADLTAWEVMPPLTPAGEFAEVECPQLVELDGWHVILFSCLAREHSALRCARLGTPGRAGTFAFRSRRLAGPWVPSDAPIEPAGQAGDVLYAGKLVPMAGGQLGFMAFLLAGDAGFGGELTDPVPARIDGSGAVVLADD